MTDGDLRYTIDRETAGGREVAVIVLDGDFDLPAVEIFDEAVEQARAGDPGAIVVDTTGLRFIDSSGLNDLARLREAVGATAVGFVVTPGSAVDRVLELSGMSELLAGAPDRSAAIAALG